MMCKDNPLPSQQPWIPLKELVEGVAEVVNNKKWRWASNTRCKYVSIRIDMRDGHAILLDRNNQLITLEQFERQAF